MEKEILDERGAAEFLGVTIDTLQAWRSAKRGPPYSKLGPGIRCAVRYSISDLRQFLKDTRINPASAASPLITAMMTK